MYSSDVARGRSDHPPSRVGVRFGIHSAGRFYPFVCPKCQAGDNEAKALVFHQKRFHKVGLGDV